MVGLRRSIHFETVLSVEADGSRVVLDDVEPHRAIRPEPFHAAPHQGVGDSTSVERRIDHHPIQLSVVLGVDRGDHVPGEFLANEGRGEKLVLTLTGTEHRFRGNAHDAVVRVQLVGRHAVDVEGRGGRPFGERRDLIAADPFEGRRVVQQVNQVVLRYRERNSVAKAVSRLAAIASRKPCIRR